MIVHVIQNQTDFPLDAQSVENIVRDFAVFYHTPFDEASICFVDTQEICRLHKEFFDDPSTTDCISFPMDGPDEKEYRVLGDVIVCPETAFEYVKMHGGDFYREITLYVVHGLLHLIGYDDLEENERDLMKKEEAKYLEHLENKSLWISSWF